jgi:hypothetical protein
MFSMHAAYILYNALITTNKPKYIAGYFGRLTYPLEIRLYLSAITARYQIFLRPLI